MACNCDDNINQSEVPSGPAGPAGIDGINAFGLTTGVATSLGGNSLSIPMSGINNSWIVVGQIVYIQSSGYYLVTAVTVGVNITVTDLLYPGNNAVPLLNGSGLKVVSGGMIGATGATGNPGNFFFQYFNPNSLIASQTDILAISNLSVGNKINLNATFMVDSSAAVTITITPRIAGIDQSSKIIRCTTPTAISSHSYISIPFVDLANNLPGQTLAFRITLDDYTKTTTIATNLVYNYQ